MLRRGCCTAARSFCHRVATPLFFPFYLHFCACVCVCLRLLAFRTRHFCILPTFAPPPVFSPIPSQKRAVRPSPVQRLECFFSFLFPPFPTYTHTRRHKQPYSHAQTQTNASFLFEFFFSGPGVSQAPMLLPMQRVSLNFALGTLPPGRESQWKCFRGRLADMWVALIAPRYLLSFS